MRISKSFGKFLVMLLSFIAFAVALWLIPKAQAPGWVTLPSTSVGDSVQRSVVQAENQARKERFLAENEARKTLAQILGGGFFLLTAYLTWRTVRATEQNLTIARENLNATQDRQNAERFAKATESLDNTRTDQTPNISVRLGGIYALERLARDSGRDHWNVVEVVAAYLREHAALRTPLPAAAHPDHPRQRVDIQAAITVLGRRGHRRTERHRVDLHSCDLRWIRMRDANFDWVNLADANLSGAKLERASLRSARLSRITLADADLRNTNLSVADDQGKTTRLRGANLSNADFGHSDLRSVDFSKANMNGVKLIGANLEGANLRSADLTQADFSGANLRGADLRGAILTGARGLGQAQLHQAITDGQTQVSSAPGQAEAPDGA